MGLALMRAHTNTLTHAFMHQCLQLWPLCTERGGVQSERAQSPLAPTTHARPGSKAS